MNNDLLQFEKAVLRVHAELRGVRWLMHEWFYTALLGFTGIATFWMSVVGLGCVLALRDKGYLRQI
jgi:hypothetical protein